MLSCQITRLIRGQNDARGVRRGFSRDQQNLLNTHLSGSRDLLLRHTASSRDNPHRASREGAQQKIFHLLWRKTITDIENRCQTMKKDLLLDCDKQLEKVS